MAVGTERCHRALPWVGSWFWWPRPDVFWVLRVRRWNSGVAGSTRSLCAWMQHHQQQAGHSGSPPTHRYITRTGVLAVFCAQPGFLSQIKTLTTDRKSVV